MAFIPKRKLGTQGLEVSVQGLGCMSMTAAYGGNFDRAAQEPESLRTIARALELGINFFDTAWIYQSFGAGGGENATSEEVIGKAIKIHGRDKFIIATKFGIGFDANGKPFVCGKEDFIRSQLAESLRRLDTDYIDLYYMHRMDVTTPIEETMRVLKALITEGKIRYIGLSECTPQELRRAHAIHPVTAIQMEWCLQTRDIEDSVVPVARELGVGIVAYSPLGRGLLADLAIFDSLSAEDSRLKYPRFSGKNLEENKRRIARFGAIAQSKRVTPAQLALAWVHSQGEDVFPIPGTKSVHRIEENAGAFRLVPLSIEEKQEIEEVAAILGERNTPANQALSYNNRL